MSEVEAAPAGTSPDELVAHVEALEERLTAVASPDVRELADELVASVMELYGEGLERVFRVLAEGDDEVLAARDRLVEDGLVASLLLIQGIHPVPLATRVEGALASVRPYLESHSGGVELLRLEGGVAHLRLQGSCDGCPSSAATLELAITQALDEAAPDLEGIEVEGVVERTRFTGSQLPLVDSQAAPAVTVASPGWTAVDGLDGLQPDSMVETQVDGARLLVANVGGTLLAYRNTCAGCGSPLAGGELEYGILACPGCSRSFQLPLAGRELGGDSLQLEPVPLLVEAGAVRMAVPA